MAITNNEILLMAEVVSREKDLEKDIIFNAIEAALATATRKLYDGDIDARVSIHRDTGDYDTYRVWEVVSDDDELEFPDRQIRLSEAKESDPEQGVEDLIRQDCCPGGQTGDYAESP